MCPPNYHSSVVITHYFFHLDCSRKTENGDCCYIPFVFGGNTYHDCTSDGWHREWCSLTDNYDDDGQWGNCAQAGRTFSFALISLNVKYNFLAF